jgi:hydrogenase/urease accessory protein HupE
MTSWKAFAGSSLFFIVSSICSSSGNVWAHESRPLYVEINETKPESFIVKWKTPRSVPAFNIPRLILPENCVQSGHELSFTISDAFLKQGTYGCTGGIAGGEIGLEFPVLNPSVSTLIRLQMLNGEKRTKLLTPGENEWQVPQSENKLRIGKEYALLGIRHILEGIDHLLFLVCLLIVAGTGRRILITITGFTVAHSITLVLSALNLVRVPVPPVEAAIALSIVFLATEIARGPRDTLTYRYPVTVSVSFGLLHGFGFAAVLKQIGLPQTEITTSLLFFNIGVEIGQLVFVGLVIVIFKAITEITKASMDTVVRIENPAAYVVGSLASFWMLERIYSFWF